MKRRNAGNSLQFMVIAQYKLFGRFSETLIGFCCCHVTGSFAVICLMVAQVVEREVGSLSLAPSPSPGNVSVPSPTPTDTSSGLWTPIESVKMEIAISLSLLVGIIQVMYFTR